MKNTVDADYRELPPGGFLDRIWSSQRRQLFDAFLRFRQPGASDSVISVCMAPSPLLDNTDYLLQWSEPGERSHITPYRIEWRNSGGYRHREWADTVRQSQRSDVFHLPFPDGAFDWAFCNEAIAHVGSIERQYGLVKELARVSRKGVFVTTSNRWHPIEFNTGLPFLHWLPAPWWRQVLKWIGKGAWASESVLNPLGSTDLYKLASLLPGKPAHDVGHKRVFGIKAHFFLMIQKNAAAKTPDRT